MTSDELWATEFGMEILVIVSSKDTGISQNLIVRSISAANNDQLRNCATLPTLTVAIRSGDLGIRLHQFAKVTTATAFSIATGGGIPTLGLDKCTFLPGKCRRAIIVIASET
jgi:hypothetical protein